jgi:hypothetical protein
MPKHHLKQILCGHADDRIFLPHHKRASWSVLRKDIQLDNFEIAFREVLANEEWQAGTSLVIVFNVFSVAGVDTHSVEVRL